MSAASTQNPALEFIRAICGKKIPDGHQALRIHFRLRHGFKLFCQAGALLLVTGAGRAADFQSTFAVVMIDEATEAKLGPFPYDRAEIAKAVEACARGHAKAVVLKFFLDQPKSAAGDDALATAMRKIPVLLQARIESAEGTPTELPARFRYAGDASAAVGGQRGWIPLPVFLAEADGVGFVDFDRPDIPLIEEYRQAPCKSLVLCCLEQATGATAHVTGKNRIELGDLFLSVDQRNMHHASLDPMEDLNIISFVSLIEGNVPASEIAGRVVIIGFDSTKTPVLATPYGPMKIHRFFVQCLAATWRELSLTSPQTPPALP
jgi:adenylate cyclase